MANIAVLIVLGLIFLIGAPIVSETPVGTIGGMLFGATMFVGGMILMGSDEIVRAIRRQGK